MTGSDQCVETVLAVFAAVEQRDDAALARACQPDVEFCWPPSLPYGGTARGLARPSEGWAAYWDRLQPTAALRRLDPRVVAAAGQEVVVLWRQRGLTPARELLDTEVLGLYRLRAGKLARGQMFYFDPAAVCAFLARASRQAPAQATPGGNRASRDGPDEPRPGRDAHRRGIRQRQPRDNRT